MKFLILAMVIMLSGCNAVMPAKQADTMDKRLPAHVQFIISSIHRICGKGDVSMSSAVREVSEVGATLDSEVRIDCGKKDK